MAIIEASCVVLVPVPVCVPVPDSTTQRKLKSI